MTNEIFSGEGGEQYQGEEFDLGTGKIISELKSAGLSRGEILEGLLVINDDLRIGKDDLRKDEEGKIHSLIGEPEEIEETLRETSDAIDRALEAPDPEIQELVTGATVASLRQLGVPDNQFAPDKIKAINEQIAKIDKEEYHFKQRQKLIIKELSDSDLSQQEVLTGLDIILTVLEKSKRPLIRERGKDRVMGEEEKEQLEPIADTVQEAYEREDPEFTLAAIDKIISSLRKLGVPDQMFSERSIKWVVEKWREEKRQMVPTEEIERIREEIGREIAEDAGADAKAEAERREKEFFEEAKKYFKRKGQDNKGDNK